MPRPRPTARRSLSALAVAALLAPLLPAVLASPASAAPAVVLRDVREFACPPGQVRAPGTAPRFDDTAGNTFELEIDCLAGYQVTLGTAGGRTYEPSATVTRAQMAQFIARVASRAGVALDTRDAGFTDIGFLPPSARDAINALANADVARGRTPTTFVPLVPVRRDQMASFVARLQEVVAQRFPAGDDYFTDDNGGTHEDATNRIARAGIVQGVSEGEYGPDRPISRQQMAGFLTRYLDGQVAAGEIPGRYVRDNQVVAVSPAESQVLSIGQERTFTATSLTPGVEYRVTLVETRTVRTATGTAGGDGTLRFTDTDGDRLAEVGSYAARITAINGRPVADGMPSTTTSVPDASGSVNVRIKGNRDTDDVVPVLYPNTGRSPRLELAADLRPVEVFGVGGRTTFMPPAADAGQTGEGVVTAHDGTRSLVTLDLDADGSGDRVYTYSRTDDQFFIAGTSQPSQTFVDRLTRGDRLKVDPYRSSSGSRFEITDDTPTAPTVTAARGDSAATAGRITVTVSPTKPAAVATYDRFVIERGSSCNPVTGACTFTQIADLSASADADAAAPGFQYVDEPEAGTYRYRASGVVDGQRSDAGTSGTVTSAPPASPDVTRPVSNTATVSRDAGVVGNADAGDQLTAVFNEALASPASDAFVQVRTTSGSLVVIRNQSNALFRVSGSTLTIDLGIGFAAGPYPLEIVDAGRITDLAGNPWAVTASPDRRFDK